MAGNKSLFTSLAKYNEGKVIVGDGVTTKICGKCTINYFGMPKFENILYVTGLKAN